MHELPITQSILDISIRYAQEAKAKRISVINIVIGEFSSFVDDSVQFYWDILAKETIAEGAVLYFERVKSEMTCLDCGTVFEPSEDSFACPQCSKP